MGACIPSYVIVGIGQNLIRDHGVQKTLLMQQKRELIEQLYQCGAIKLETTRTKNGQLSPIYFDVRSVISYPATFRLLVQMVQTIISDLNVDVICAVPYGAVPLATASALYGNYPMIMQRKQAKTYGTQRIIEGMFHPGASCLVIEDVITTGSSILETIGILEHEDLTIHDVIVVIDREQGGVAHVQRQGYTVHAVCTLSEVITTLLDAGLITCEQYDTVKYFCAKCTSATKPHDLTYAQRADLTHNPVAKKLFTIMEKKQTNLAVAADVTSKAELLALADEVGPEICVLKTHIDIVKDFDWDLIIQLKKLAHKYNFLIAEDRKFADIGSTVYEQYTGGIYRIAEWADIIIAHSIAGPESIKALVQAARAHSCALLLIASLSSANNMITDTYTQQVVALAQVYDDFVIGFITQHACTTDPRFVLCTPGIHTGRSSDNLGQQYSSPEHAIDVLGSDIIIVGRAIYKAPNPRAVAREYRIKAWR